MNSYTWDIRGFKLENRDTLQDIVNTVLFRITVTDPTGQYSRWLDSEAYLAPVDLTNFISYTELDQSTVVQWIKNCYTVEDYAKTLAGLDKNLADYIDDTVNQSRIVTELPWGVSFVKNPHLGHMPTAQEHADYAAKMAEQSE